MTLRDSGFGTALAVRLFCAGLLCILPLAVPDAGAAEEAATSGKKTQRIDFQTQIAPLLANRCLGCHHRLERKGGLSLESAGDLTRGGHSGSVVEPSDADSSLLLEMVLPVEGKARMPKGSAALSEAEIALLRAWIDQGATWPDSFLFDPAMIASATWWSLRPLHRPAVPNASLDPAEQAANPIDRFVAAKLAAQQLTFSPEAERRTLIRRLSYDLLGLPPDPDLVAEFVASRDPLAYEQLVDRLLSSPQYGERWARHWLDVVHFGETHGYDKDQPRPNAWPYRDYVISALNADLPYRDFVAQQLAADVLFADRPDLLPALGFISAGPWDLIGHAEVPESKIDGKIARHLDRDDMVSNTINTFCGLTVQCAQCHDHKFDPITQADYYSLQSVFAAVDRADRPYFDTPADQRRYQELKSRQQQLTRLKTETDQQIAQLAGPRLAELDQQLQAARKTTGERPPQHGYHSQIESAADRAKWVQVDLGQPKAISRLTLIACDDDFNGIGPGFGFPARFKVEVSNDPQFATGVTVVVDRTKEEFRNPGVQPQTFDLRTEPMRYLRVTATKLALRQNDYIFALSELEALDADGQNMARGAAVTALDSIEAPIRWGKSNLVDGIAPRGRASSDAIAKLELQRTELLQSKVGPGLLKQQADLMTQQAEVQHSLSQLPPAKVVYSGTVHTGSGAFTGTGASDGRPRAIHILPRGDVTRPGEEVGPGALQSLTALKGRFNLPEGHREADRRAALARWIIDERNPLTWRVIVNRIWLYHFGRGLVDTPNDFGRMGQEPTHPELLDWLAVEFRDGGQSLKQLHRLIVTSHTYRQTSRTSESAPAIVARASSIDADNRLYWRMNRRRIEAEALRDTMLAVSGELDGQMSGPSFRDFVVTHPEHSPHYNYHLHDPEDPRARRRSVYRFLVRSQTQPFMTVFDCADPSLLVDKRSQSISPLQALALLNSALSLNLSTHFAQRLEQEQAVQDRGQTQSPEERQAAMIRRACQLTLSRDPTQDELQLLAAYAREHGFANCCRLIFSLNELTFVD